MKILLFGKSGQLGWELNHSLSSYGNLIAVSRSEVNFEVVDSVVNFIRQTKPQFIINAVAYTAVDRAEVNRELANLVNSVLPGVIADECKKLNSVMIHYSTDYVYDGTKGSMYIEQDPANPLNYYGQSKLNGEAAIHNAGCNYVIFRTSWVYSLRGDNFVSKILKWSRQREVLRVVSDQIGSPTWARMLARITARVIAKSQPLPLDYFSTRNGIYHLGGSGSVSRFDFARYVLDLDPVPGEQKMIQLESALTADFPTPATRPLNTALDCSLFERIFCLKVPDWRKSLRLAMQNELV